MEDQSAQPKTILVVNDEEAIRTFVLMLLSIHGYNVLTADSGEVALQQSREYKGIIHLLLANIQMQGMTGIELGSKFHADRPNTRVMLMSGFSSGLLVLNEGWHFLPKPFISSQLLAIISNILNAPVSAQFPDLDEHRR